MSITCKLLPGTVVMEIKEEYLSFGATKTRYFYKDLVSNTRPYNTLGIKEDTPVCDAPMSKTDIKFTEKYNFPRLTEDERNIVLQARKRAAEET